MEIINIDFEKDLNINKVREEINLVMFNNPKYSFKDMKLANELFKRLANVKVKINVN